MLECPICDKKPNQRNNSIQCCGLIIFDSSSCSEWKVGEWNNMVIEYRKMIALEKIANNQHWCFYSMPSVYPPYTVSGTSCPTTVPKITYTSEDQDSQVNQDTILFGENDNFKM